MPIKKMWDYAKKEFMLRKGKIYSLSGKERGEICKFINE